MYPPKLTAAVASRVANRGTDPLEVAALSPVALKLEEEDVKALFENLPGCPPPPTIFQTDGGTAYAQLDRAPGGSCAV